MNETTKEPFWERCGDTTPRDRRNMVWVVGALFFWALSFAGVQKLIEKDLLPAGPLPWLLAALPAVAGILVIVMYGRFLRDLDELQRLIQLQGIALAFGGAYFAYAGYQIFERLGAPPADMSAYVVVWSVLYSFRSYFGWRRFG